MDEKTQTNQSPTPQVPQPIQVPPITQQPNHNEFSQPQLETKATHDNKKYYAIISLICTIIDASLWACCAIASGGSGNENGPGAVWWLLAFYYDSVGIPIVILSIVFGIKGLRTKLRWIAILSLILKAIMVITILATIWFIPYILNIR